MSTRLKLALLIAFSVGLFWSNDISYNDGRTNAAAPDLFLSEYVEGSSFNKAIEIYNGTGATVDLADYVLELYSNGSASVSQSTALSGTLADGDVFVAAHASAQASILAEADVTNSSVINFNGNDAVVLRKDGDVVDAIGQVGFDPVTQWGSGDVSTMDNTIRRMPGICVGDTNETDAFDPAAEWDGFASDTFDGLGTHDANCEDGAGDEDPVINEFSASTAGTDVEYVEIFGEPDTDYSAFTVLEIEGDSGSDLGAIDEVIAVGTTDANGFHLANLPANALENGTITLLLVNNFTGNLGDDLDTDNDGVLDSEPWDTVDAVAVNDGGAGDLTYGMPALGPNYDGLSSFAPGGASRLPDGEDTDTAADWARNDFDLAGIPGFDGTPQEGEALNTPGAPNELIDVDTGEFGVCGDPATLIHDIQGSGAASPLVGEVHVIEGVVTGIFPELDGGAFAVQEEDAETDADPATSEGIMVFDSANSPLVGDTVRVQGTVVEDFNNTQLEPVADFANCGAGVLPAPATLSLPVASLDDFEPFEGMYVRFTQALYISEYFNFDRFGEIVLSSQRQYQATAQADPQGPPNPIIEANLLDRITLDDGRSAQNPDPAIHPNGLEFDLSNRFRGGDTVEDVTGVLQYAFSLYRIQPTQGAVYAPLNVRTPAPDNVGGDLTVASFNVLNYFTTIDTGAFICGPAGNQECRGADDADELTRQRDKIIAALVAIDADVVGLIEIENHPADVPTADLVSGLNDALGTGTYDYIVTGAIGTDAIRQALIYKPGAVTPIGAFAVLDSTVDPRFLDQKNRPVLAQTFMDNATGNLFTVAVNHLKSKGSDCNDVGDPDLGDGAGNCNITRREAAEALVDWLATDPTSSGDPRLPDHRRPQLLHLRGPDRRYPGRR